MTEKVKFPMYLEREEKDELEHRFYEDGSSSQNQFLGNALRFYLDYLNTKKADECMSESVRGILEGRLKILERKLSGLIFKQAVEMEMMMRILCDSVEIPEEYLQEVRTKSVKSVKLTNGQLQLEQIAKMGEDDEC